MKTCTLFAMAKARQFEAEFESIQKEWNRNHRMRNMMFTYGQKMSRCTLIGGMRTMSGHCQAGASIGRKCSKRITIGMCNKCMNIHYA